MVWLFLGLLLWYSAHWLKRLAPSIRNAMNQRFGDNGARGIMGGLLALSVILMVIGYSGWDSGMAYTANPSWGWIGFFLTVLGVVLMGGTHSKSRIRLVIRHPMLTGFSLWGLGHLIFRGDWASVVLFGGLVIWAVLTILLINKQDGKWEKPDPNKLSLAGDIRLVLIGLVISAVLVAIHVFGFGMIS